MIRLPWRKPAPAEPAPIGVGSVLMVRRGSSSVAMPATAFEVLDDGYVLVEFQHIPVVQSVRLADLERNQ